MPQPIQSASWGERLASNVVFWLWLSMASLVPLLELASHADEPAVASQQAAETAGRGAINVELP